MRGGCPRRAALPVALAALAGGAAGAAPRGAAAQAAPAAGSDAIRLDQVGFLPDGPKTAIVAAPRATRFAVVGAERGDTVLVGRLDAPARWALSGETVRRARFDAVGRPGRYRLVVAGVGTSHPFAVGADAFGPVATAALRGFYFQRASTALPAAHAGPWARPAGHPDDAVLVHPSAADARRPAGTRLASPGGWYDAGDYNKYVVNSAISTVTLLLIAEHFPRWADTTRLAIPERGGALPDLVDEALWNLRWMRTMQDPADGGVYHKLTNAEFDGLAVMPHDARAPRWVVQKSTAATLDFAATMAHAARLVRRWPAALPGLADSLTAEAAAAWRWARAHPDSLYDQRRLNAATRPAIRTGAYDDRALADERRWAAAELALTTGDAAYLADAAPLAALPADVPGWGSVGTMGLIALLDARGALPAAAAAALDTAAVRGRLLALADTLVARARRSPYGVPLDRGDLVWGSSAVAANQGLVLVQAHRLTGEHRYRDAAIDALDWLLGRNPTGHSFVTGVGARSPRHPHHRPSVADTVAAPVPGLLVGGPNPGRQDGCAGYPSALPARAWVDGDCSYASNEIAINWNAPLAYLAAALDALRPGRAAAAR